MRYVLGFLHGGMRFCIRWHALGLLFLFAEACAWLTSFGCGGVREVRVVLVIIVFAVVRAIFTYFLAVACISAFTVILRYLVLANTYGWFDCMWLLRCYLCWLARPVLQWVWLVYEVFEMLGLLVCWQFD